MIRSAIELTPDKPFDRLGSIGAAAESVGFDTVFVSSHYNNRDPFVVLDRLVRATDRISLGPGVVNPYETHPVALAGRLATLQSASDGRAIYGLGAGDRSTLATLGLEHDRPLQRIRETIEVSRSLFAGERVTHDGTFSASDAGLTIDGLEPMPIYLGAQGPGMLALAGALADGVLINACHPRDLEWSVDRIATGQSDRPSSLDAPTVLSFASVSVDHDASAAERAARPPVAFIVAGAPPPVLDRHEIDRSVAESIGAALARGAYGEAVEAVTPTMLDAFAIAGDPPTVADRLEAVLSLVDGVVVGSPLGPDPVRSVELAGDLLADLNQ